VLTFYGGLHDMSINKIEQKLLDGYKTVFRHHDFPDWAYQYYPPIPHVGNRVDKKNVRCIVYGSAENLKYTRDRPDAEINSLEEEQWYRHRYYRKYDKYFPFVHIEPINNGSLLIVARYILALLGYDKTFSNEPKEFIEEITVGNFGKYSIDHKTNIDYADKYKCLKYSMDYVLTDIDSIKPDIIILPKRIYDFQSVRKKLIPSLIHGSVIIPTYQAVRRAIGVMECNSIKRNDFAFESTWLSSISDSGINAKEMRKYLSWLDCRIKDIVVEIQA